MIVSNPGVCQIRLQTQRFWTIYIYIYILTVYRQIDICAAIFMFAYPYNRVARIRTWKQWLDFIWEITPNDECLVKWIWGSQIRATRSSCNFTMRASTRSPHVDGAQECGFVLVSLPTSPTNQFRAKTSVCKQKRRKTNFPQTQQRRSYATKDTSWNEVRSFSWGNHKSCISYV